MSQAEYERQFQQVTELSGAVRKFQREFPRAEISATLNIALDRAAIELANEFERLRERHKPGVT